jgi:hypothetical protein
MQYSLADLFEHGHTYTEVMNMGYFDEYLFMIRCINEKRMAETKQHGERELRPVQKDAIKKAKNLKK